METKDLQIRIWDVEGIGYLRQGKYERAWPIFRQQYELLLKIQKEKGVRIHKGGSLHNGGLSLLYQGKTDEALRWLIFALVEDLISSERNTNTDLAPASRVLRGVCGASWKDLEPIEKVVFEEKNRTPVMRPEDIEPSIQDAIKSIQSNYRKYLEHAWQLEIDGQKGIEDGDFESAVSPYERWRKLLYDYQEKRGERVHKGHVLFNLGFVLYHQNKIPNAVHYFLQANVENIISTRVPEHIKEASSFNVLNQLGLGDVFDDLQSWTTEKIDSGVDVSLPDMLLDDFLKEKQIEILKLTPRVKEAEIETAEMTTPEERGIDDLLGTYSDRVFIGGAYGEGLLDDELREIARYVKDRSYEPVIAVDYDPPRDTDESAVLNVHDFDILLIHMCRYVIFSLSQPGGEYNEVEWSIRMLRKPTWGVCKKEATSNISTLISDLFEEGGNKIFPYSEQNVLKDYIEHILPDRTTDK